MLDSTAAIYPELERNGYIAAGRIQDKLWTVPTAADLAATTPTATPSGRVHPPERRAWRQRLLLDRGGYV